MRRTSQAHGLKTDASFRFERGTDPYMVPVALQRAALLLQEVAGRAHRRAGRGRVSAPHPQQRGAPAPAPRGAAHRPGNQRGTNPSKSSPTSISKSKRNYDRNQKPGTRKPGFCRCRPTGWT
ncbi:MAG: phenylalanine--tRNA ligase beta subunit-related protein [Hymenobacter sp.]